LCQGENPNYPIQLINHKINLE